MESSNFAIFALPNRFVPESPNVNFIKFMVQKIIFHTKKTDKVSSYFLVVHSKNREIY